MLALANYETSFTLHLRLILTPLYGDYTKAGRVIGLVFRLLAIWYGLTVLVLVGILVVLSPLLWYLGLVLVFYEFKLWAVLGALVFFALWWN